MSAMDNISHPQFGALKVQHEEVGDYVGHQRVAAWFDRDDDDHGLAGYISHQPAEDGRRTTVRVLHVEDDRRRMGVATGLMKALEARYPEIDHGERTKAGAAWWDRYQAKR